MTDYSRTLPKEYNIRGGDIDGVFRYLLDFSRRNRSLCKVLGSVTFLTNGVLIESVRGQDDLIRLLYADTKQLEAVEKKLEGVLHNQGITLEPVKSSRPQIRTQIAIN